MQDTDQMASRFSESIKPSKNNSFETNVNIYAMHSIPGASRWGKNTSQNVCPVLGELYLMLIQEDSSNPDVLENFAPKIVNTYKNDVMAKRAFALVEMAQKYAVNDESKMWLKEAREKFELTDGLLEDKHYNAIFRGNQYVFVAYAFVEILKSENKIKNGWDALQTLTELQ